MRSIISRRSLAALFVAAVSISGFSQAQAETLRIGFQKSAATLSLLRASGTLEKRLADQDVDVKWVEFPGGPQLLEGLNVGSVDFGLTGETPPVFAQAASADLLYIAYEPASPTSEAILVSKDSPIKSVAELKGKRVALNKGSNVHYQLVRALEEAGLKYSDIQPVYLPPADARAAFESGSVDAWVIWDPFLAAAEQQLQARTLRDGKGLVNNFQFYLATGKYAKNSPQVLSVLVDEVRKVGEQIKSDYASATKQIAPILGLSEAITRTSVERQQYGAQFITPEVTAAQQQIADAFTQLKLLPKALVIKDVIWTPPANIAKAQ
ncbi:sulfonate ABC transporter substrate-binding protein [Pseudomonas sp. 5P_3.1_Bac2]|uniref:sulfonate ABC transporter substrate-binding protein n=1 Tax=Pseudomonas sp. 5P_3.1_Bac2 TaxID=2971617 RepID=UPI0021C811F2|nr:sulfonate ABC transporter substrate-binding protein [Pseudomonas sp. 5P_3.1_Bac2]MCU1719436.1 sulfonate ABC transporter substrate-binding protein [Pseudomonas sp. 5P_3.1_Bac2]